MALDRYFSRVGGVAAILGTVCLVVATFMHPMTADPASPPAAFAEYAADPNWIASHLGQLFGAALFTGGLIALSWRLCKGRAAAWAVLSGAGAVAALALSGALQAVDGIASKVMVDRWADAPPETRSALFEAAFAVRQIEIGLASITMLFFGATAMLYAGAFWLTEDAPDWLAWFAFASGAALLVSGVAHAYTGFSASAMMVSMPANLLLMIWGVAVGLFLLRSTDQGRDLEQRATPAV